MAAASSAVLALTLTGCGDGDAGSETVESAGKASSDTNATPRATSASLSASASAASASVHATKTASAHTAEKENGVGSGAVAGKTTSAGTGSGNAKPVDCSTGSLKFAVHKVTSPINHVLITATNTGSTACRIYTYPALALSESAQAETSRIGESKPPAVVTLGRGATAYAGLITATLDRNSDSKIMASSIGLSLHGPDEGDLTTEGGVTVPVPGGSLYVEQDNAQVTYWQDNRNDALAW
ncbi:DUF4232 domain-containing protein [Streptomyces canus]|uniref:DUF4232 domain-containing protein n=1 Tax=Streptomyces canus TaxID=58343 RepID=UPI0037F8988F